MDFWKHYSSIFLQWTFFTHITSAVMVKRTGRVNMTRAGVGRKASWMVLFIFRWFPKVLVSAIARVPGDSLSQARLSTWFDGVNIKYQMMAMSQPAKTNLLAGIVLPCSFPMFSQLFCCLRSKPTDIVSSLKDLKKWPKNQTSFLICRKLQMCTLTLFLPQQNRPRKYSISPMNFSYLILVHLLVPLCQRNQ